VADKLDQVDNAPGASAGKRAPQSDSDSDSESEADDQAPFGSPADSEYQRLLAAAKTNRTARRRAQFGMPFNTP